MIGNITIVGLQTAFTNGDKISVDITVERHQSDPYFSNLVQGISAKLMCRGQFLRKGRNEIVNFYSSPGVDASINYITQDTISSHVDLQFPHRFLEFPSTLRFDGSMEGVEWFVIARVNCQNDDFMLIALPCDFVQSSFSVPAGVKSAVYTDMVDGTNFELVASYPSYGTSNLRDIKSGLYLRLEGLVPGKFNLQKLRVHLEEVTRFSVDGEVSVLPPRYFEMSSFIPSREIPLDDRTFDLSQYACVSGEGLALVPTYHSEELHHFYNLVVHIGLAYWDYSAQERREVEKRVAIGEIDVRERPIDGYASLVDPELRSTAIYDEDDYRMEDEYDDFLHATKDRISNRITAVDYEQDDSDEDDSAPVFDDIADSHATSAFESQPESMSDEPIAATKQRVARDWDDTLTLIKGLAL